ncbi:MAG: PQQ-dependent sugar dehydrogenase [Flavobacteriales bacterium]|nr:PQQ-dependent sugar dehydrogenase [Flavobacteriales bacterium]
MKPRAWWFVVGALPLMSGVCQPTLFAGDPRLEELVLPEGFHISIYATGVKSAREMCWGSKGTLFVGSRDEGCVYALLDTDQDHVADQVITVVKDLKMPVGVAFKDGDLYISAVSSILRLRGIEDHLNDPPAPEVVTSAYPSETHHGWKFIAFGPDGKLYVPVGAPCNICASSDSIYASITRINVNGGEPEIIAKGVRNTVGFDWDPRDSSLWFTENGRDMMGDDLPDCELNKLTRIGEHFGYPYCHAGDVADPEFGVEHTCSDFTPPAAKLGPHVAPLGMRFYRGNMFPESYRGAIIIAEHGSWNRSKPIGYRLVVAHPQPDGSATQEVFAEGWLKGSSAWGRPVDVLEMPDGSLLVSDDAADLVYRISYKAKP